ncbi:hypothetical protein [Stenotrophomonas sp. 364]|uniref:hypothetical protein n=1 Tax=Stenotrophomonas sp. 364 TaxID=2691571 RepID=UPI0013188C44|nr:hypothetical protein [Stenotrophomonas sp. 364]QHB72115.1 hypothetical protein GQ674_12815 [Stenotrophomonas sp. 364]
MNSQPSVIPNAVMYWDGGERAITPREKATIEEHGPSCFTIPLAPPIDVDNMLADCVPGGSITDPQAVADNIRAWFAKPADLAVQKEDGSLSTSEGGRRYVADFFVRELRRHDFTRYITTTLAADFACALAQHLAATGKQQVGEVQEPVSEKAVRQFIADRATNDEHREDILSGDYDHTAWFDHIRELMEALAARQPVAHQQPSFGKVQEIRIPARNKLDPISVFVQDQAWGRGRIVVTCYGNAWQGFWGAMGDRTVMQFVAQCDADYVAGNMISGRQTRMTKAERAYTQRIAAEVITEFRNLIGGQRDAAPGVGNG